MPNYVIGVHVVRAYSIFVEAPDKETVKEVARRLDLSWLDELDADWADVKLGTVDVYNGDGPMDYVVQGELPDFIDPIQEDDDE